MDFVACLRWPDLWTEQFWEHDIDIDWPLKPNKPFRSRDSCNCLFYLANLEFNINRLASKLMASALWFKSLVADFLSRWPAVQRYAPVDSVETFVATEISSSPQKSSMLELLSCC